MHYHYLLLTTLLFSNSTSSQSIPSNKKINFDSDWKFQFGNASNPEKDFNFSIAPIFSKSGKSEQTAIDPAFNDSAWKSVQLPHDWAVELPFVNSSNFNVMSHGYKPVGGQFPSTSIGWYRKHFIVAMADSGQRFQLQFDGIFRDATIWINGFYLGNNKSGYVGVSYDITDFVHFGSQNTVVVRVDATQYEGWFYEGAGIYRHVWLTQTDPLHIATDGVYIHTTVGLKASTVEIETEVENQDLIARKFRVAAYITDRSGNQITTAISQVNTAAQNEIKTVKQQLLVTSPSLWSTDSPYLYLAHVRIEENGKWIDDRMIKFGIRTINIDSRGLFVNGQYTKVHGTNNHQDHAGVGSALPDHLQYYRVRLLKQLGVNAYRTSHHAPTPELLDACDSLGILVLDEQRLLNSAPEYMSQFERLIKRDRNRACVFLWSIGNEEGYVQTSSIGKRLAQTFLSKQRLWDPSRTSTYAADLGNVFHGANEIIPVRGFNYRQFDVDNYHRDHPRQPILGTEMGSTVTTRGVYSKDTVLCYLPDEDITAPWWASTAETWWTLAATRPWWMGGFVWTGFDYRGEPTPFHWPNINSHFGIMDMCGFQKNIYYYYQSWWQAKNWDVLHISPHWNWKSINGSPVNVWVNSNADSVELFLNAKTLGKKTMPPNKHLEWLVPFEPGLLSATGWRNGHQIYASVQTAGPASALVVNPSTTTILADGQDGTVINISVVDRQGVEVPEANNLIHFSVTGDAKIIGTGNGDPSSHEQDVYQDTVAQRSLFNGKCQVIIRSGRSRSIIKFSAQSEHLSTANTTIFSIQPGLPHLVQASGGHSGLNQSLSTPKAVGQMLGADISFLPQLEARGTKFYDKKIQKDAIQILKDHGFNYIRLRTFVNPGSDSGYSPKKGFCDLSHTLEMAKRIKAVGMKILLDFHYSDDWADPQQQKKPSTWNNMTFVQLKNVVTKYSYDVMLALQMQGSLPDMVQVGNEINHGFIWPEGNVNNMDTLAELICAGIAGIKKVDPSIPIMLHIALGGQNEEAHFFLDNMVVRGVPFSIIGLSYYPKWHGTTEDLKYNLWDLSAHYGKDVIVVEYSEKKREVNEIVFTVPNRRGKGTCIWEPLNTWESLFDKQGESTNQMLIYDEISKQYLAPRP